MYRYRNTPSQYKTYVLVTLVMSVYGICTDVETPLLSLPPAHLMTLVRLLGEQNNWAKMCQLLLAYRSTMLGPGYKWTHFPVSHSLAARDKCLTADSIGASALKLGKFGSATCN
jgi:hypothetical protein